MPFGFFGRRQWSSDGEDDAARRAQQEARRQEEEDRRLREIEERNERLLPWDLEQKVAMVLNPIKVPFILAAGLLGSVVELRIRAVAEDTWYRGFFGLGPECVVHKADYGELRAEIDDLSALMKKLDGLLFPVESGLNKSLQKIASNCTTEHNITSCDLLNGPILNYSFAPDNCYVEYDETRGRCTSESELSERPGMEHESGGLVRSLYVPYAFVWMLFKLIWLPGHYIDRAARLAAGGSGPTPEPILKLISEPTCDRLGWCGRCADKLGILGSVSKVIRFSLLPNTLILPLTSIRYVQQCQGEYIIYSHNASFGFGVYAWLLFEVVTMLILYVAAQTVLGGKALGTKWYGMYTFFSFVRTVVALNMYFFDLVCCFSWRFWEGLSVILQLAFTLDFTANVTFDIAKTVANTVVVLDYLQFTIMVWSFLCPRLLARLPVPACLREWTARPDDIARSSEEPPPSV